MVIFARFQGTLTTPHYTPSYPKCQGAICTKKAYAESMKLRDNRLEIPVQSGKIESSAEEKARLFWETRLKDGERIKAPQNPQCKFAIVVPVYNEKPERILKQIESLRTQQGMDSSDFEVIYVVGNDVPDGTARSQEVIAANQAVLEMLKTFQGVNVFGVDKSSPGKEVKESNVGKVRNRGIAEASIRFHENGKDGILIQTDADSYFEDPDYLKKVGEVLRQNPEATGIAGGFVFEFDPDTTDHAEIEILRAKVTKFKLLKEWEYMIEFLQDPASQSFFQNDSFVGPNIITRSFETAVVGGLDDVSLGEADNLAKKLKNLATNQGRSGQAVLGMKKELLIITALRESERTGGSFKAAFDEIDLEKPLMGPIPFAPKPADVRKRILEQIEANLHNPDGLKKVLINHEGDLLCGEEGFQELVVYLATRKKLDITEPFLVAWQQKYFAPLQAIFYPKIPITNEAMTELESKVLQHPDGKKFIDSMRARLNGIRIRQD